MTMKTNPLIHAQHAAKSSRLVKLCSLAVVCLLGLAMHGQAQAANIPWDPSAAFQNCNAGPFQLVLPSDTRVIGRDHTAGTVSAPERIGPWTPWTTINSWWVCQANYTPNPDDAYLAPPNPYWGTYGETALGAAVASYAENGKTYPVYATNVPGIGMVIAAGWVITQPTSYTRAAPGAAIGVTWGLIGGSSMSQWSGDGGITWQFYPVQLNMGASFNFAFVKYGAVTPGKIDFSYNGGVVAHIRPTAFSVTTQPYPILDTGTPVDVMLSDGPTFVLGACTTPDVTVQLGSHNVNEFPASTGPISTSATDFNINLTNCPAGLQGINYRIDASTPIVDATQSVVALDGTGTPAATGVGVQLLDSSSAPMPLGQQKTLSTYSPTTGGDYTIPLKARYYRLSSAPITQGDANSAMTFTMWYL